MKSIRSKITLITVIAIVLSVSITALIGINSVRDLGNSSSEKLLYLLCKTGQKNLDHYFDSIKQSATMVSSFAEADLEETDISDLQAHVDRVDEIMTYYYRIDPEVTNTADGFWYVDIDGEGFIKHQVTDISSYDTSDTSQLVWYTVPKATGKSVWLNPYYTENLGALVLSYNVPIFKESKFIGVIGIEFDYSVMEEQVNNIRLYDNGYAFINDKNGDIICHPYIDVGKLNDENKPRAPEGLLTDKEDLRYTYNGVEKQAVTLKLSNDMRLNVTVPVSEINGNWKSFVNLILIASVLILVVFILISLQFAGHITRPLVDLTHAAEEANNGNYDVELPVRGDDEAGVLTQTFNQLITNIKKYITELNEVNSRLKEDNITLEAATTRDSLTGVKNRFALRRDYTLYSDAEIHLMMLDIDDFKQVNDTYGHSVGDFLLKKTGDALIELFGTDHSYRYGGDEFIVIIPRLTDEEFSEKITTLESLLGDIHLEEKKLPVHFSAGYVSGKTLLQDDLRFMLRQADELLYRAKESGKNAFIGDSYNRTLAKGIKKKAEEAFRRG